MHKKFIIIMAIIIGLALLTVSLFIVNPTVFATEDEYLIPVPADLEPGTEILCAETGLNLRETPTIYEDNILIVLEENESLIFLGWKDKWVYVQYNDEIVGYCSYRYLLYDPNPVATPTPTTEPTPTPTIQVTATPTTEIATTPEPTIACEEVPRVTTKDYVNHWKEKSIGEKLSAIPIWLFIIIALGILIIVIYKLMNTYRK